MLVHATHFSRYNIQLIFTIICERKIKKYDCCENTSSDKYTKVNFNNLDIFYHPDIELAIFFARKNLAKFDPTHSTTPSHLLEYTKWKK